jgi:hypothetical protein
VILTTNLGVAQSGRILDDPTVAVACSTARSSSTSTASYRMRARRARAESLAEGLSASAER